MIKTIILYSTLLFTNLRKVNEKIQATIYESSIPKDCKKLFLAVTILESNWHDNSRAIQLNNYSGFMYKGRLKYFKSIKAYRTFCEKWFRKKKIITRKHFIKLILDGKYANLSKNNCKKYLTKLVKIEQTL